MKYFLLLILPILVHVSAFAQTNNDLQTLRTEANLKSGNNRDVLINFFQLAFNDLTGPDKQFRFSTNLFALKLKGNPDLNIDTHYIKHKFMRNSNVDFAIRFGEKFAFNGAAVGYRLALINKRDFSSSEEFLKELSVSFGTVGQIATRATPKISELAGDDDAKFSALQKELNSFLQDSTIQFSSLSPDLQGILEQSLEAKLTPDFNYKTYTRDKTNETIKKYHDKFLWTIDAQVYSYSDAAMFQQIAINTRATAGMGRIKKQHNLEYDVRAGLTYVDDTLSLTRVLDRSMAYAEGGLNLVLRNKTTQKSFLECKAALQWQYILDGLRPNETENQFYLAGTMNLRITDNIWIPLRIQYDPQHANVLGFLSVKSNFDWLGQILGQ